MISITSTVSIAALILTFKLILVSCGVVMEQSSAYPHDAPRWYRPCMGNRGESTNQNQRNTPTAPPSEDLPYVVPFYQKNHLLDMLLDLMSHTGGMQTTMIERNSRTLEKAVPELVSNTTHHDYEYDEEPEALCSGENLPMYEDIEMRCLSIINETLNLTKEHEIMARSYCVLSTAAAFVDVMKPHQMEHENRIIEEISLFTLMDDLQLDPTFGLYTVLCHMYVIHHQNQRILLHVPTIEIVPPIYRSNSARSLNIKRVSMDFEMSHIVCRLISRVQEWISQL